MNKTLLSREKYIGGSSVLKKSSKGMQCQKIVDLQKSHPSKTATSGVNQMLQESQAETIILETPRREQ